MGSELTQNTPTETDAVMAAPVKTCSVKDCSGKGYYFDMNVDKGLKLTHHETFTACKVYSIYKKDHLGFALVSPTEIRHRTPHSTRKEKKRKNKEEKPNQTKAETQKKQKENK